MCIEWSIDELAIFGGRKWGDKMVVLLQPLPNRYYYFYCDDNAMIHANFAGNAIKIEA